MSIDEVQTISWEKDYNESLPPVYPVVDRLVVEAIGPIKLVKQRNPAGCQLMV